MAETHVGLEEFSVLATELETSHADSFVTAGVDTAGVADYWIEFTTAPDQAVLDDLAQLPVSVEVRTGAPASAVEMQTVSESLTRAIAEEPSSIAAVMTAYDADQHVMTLIVEPADEAPTTQMQGLVDRAYAAALLPTGHLPLPVKLEEVADLGISEEVTVQGGRNITLCTGGFTAKRNGNRGLLTAKHCPDSTAYNGQWGVLSGSPATPAGAVDIQFHRTLTGNGHSTNKQFRWSCKSGCVDRTVLKVANAPIDSPVCKYGAKTDYGCAKVADRNQCISVGGTIKCRLDVTNKYITAKGDSGGP